MDKTSIPALSAVSLFSGVRSQHEVQESYFSRHDPNTTLPANATGQVIGWEIPTSQHYTSLSESFFVVDVDLDVTAGSTNFGVTAADNTARLPSICLNEQGVHGLFSTFRCQLNGVEVASEAKNHSYAMGSYFRQIMLRNGSEVGGAAHVTFAGVGAAADCTLNEPVLQISSEGTSSWKESVAPSEVRQAVTLTNQAITNSPAFAYRCVRLALDRTAATTCTATFTFTPRDTLFECPRFLPPNQRLAIQFELESAAAAIGTVEVAGNNNSRVTRSIRSMQFFQRHYRLSDLTAGAIARERAMRPLVYPVVNTRYQTVNLPQSASFQTSGLLSGPRPSAILVCTSSSSAWTTAQHNIANLQFEAVEDVTAPYSDVCKIIRASCQVGGIQYPRTEFQDKSGQGRKPAITYEEYLHAVNARDGGKTPMLTRAQWDAKPGMVVFNIDPLSAELALEGDMVSRSEITSVGFNLEFSKVPDAGSELQVIAFYANRIEITAGNDTRKTY